MAALKPYHIIPTSDSCRGWCQSLSFLIQVLIFLVLCVLSLMLGDSGFLFKYFVLADLDLALGLLLRVVITIAV